MSGNGRNRRIDVPHEEVQRAPRSGGRTAARRSTVDTGPRVTGTARRDDAGVRGARRYPTDGATALRVEAAQHRPASRERAATAPRLKVAPPPPVSVPRAPFVALVLVVVVAGVLGILMINTKTNENAFRLDELQRRQTALNLQQQQLEQQIATHEDPGTLHAAARRLGLVEPGPPAFIRLPDGELIGVPKPAGGQVAITSQQGGD